ncbi:MAG: pyruvate kinase [Alphaproteobacteria bacterium]|nr:pyruvate kinase [Alphaproteobacteria bacterium]
MRRSRNAKIIATLGPASGTPEKIAALFRAGADVFRLNMSHGSHEEHRARLNVIRRLEEEMGRPIGILLDLQGPKLRIGDFSQGSAYLEKDASFRLDLDPHLGNEKRICLPHPEIFAALKPGEELLLDDGRLKLLVERCGADYANTRVIEGGQLSNHKGVNLPGVILPLTALTPKDVEDLDFGLDIGVDWIALSFVQRTSDVTELKMKVAGRAGVLAKLEKPSAVVSSELAGIIAEADALMVARGDLGVECPPERVPILQKQIVAACRQAGKPVVVATQMLESMVTAPVPTRAEASDVATAVYDGADAVMLSAETAAGQHPLEAVAIMDRIIQSVEADPLFERIRTADQRDPTPTMADAIASAARQVAHTIKASAIVTYTSSGFSAMRVARERPDVPILGLTPRSGTARRLTLAWGVHPIYTNREIKNVPEMVEVAAHAAAQDYAKRGGQIVIVAGVPFGAEGTTNMLRVARV